MTIILALIQIDNLPGIGEIILIVDLSSTRLGAMLNYFYMPLIEPMYQYELMNAIHEH